MFIRRTKLCYRKLFSSLCSGLYRTRVPLKGTITASKLPAILFYASSEEVWKLAAVLFYIKVDPLPKLIPVANSVSTQKQFLVLAAAVGFGFAVIENFRYL